MRDRVLMSTLAAALFVASPIRGVSLRPGDILVSDASLKAIVQVDPVTGDRRILSSSSVGSGPTFGNNEGIAVESDGGIVVVERHLERVLRVEPITGDRSIVTDSLSFTAPVGSGPPLGTSFGIAVAPDDTLLVASVLPTGGLVMRVDPASGDRTQVTSPTVGSGTVLDGARAIAVEASGDLGVMQDGTPNAIYRVDPTTGARTLVSAFSVMGTGEAFTTPRDLIVHPDGDFLVSSAAERRTMKVDEVSGDRQTYSGCTDVACSSPVGTGPIYSNWTGLRREESGDVVQTVSDRLIEIESGSGDRQDLSGPTMGSGPALGAPVWVDVVPPGLLVADPADGTLVVPMVRSLTDPVPFPGAVLMTFTPLARAVVRAAYDLVPRPMLGLGPPPAGFRLPQSVQVFTFEIDAAHEAGVELVLSYDETLLGGVPESALSVWVVPPSGPRLVCSPNPALNECAQPAVVDTVANTISVTVDQLPVTLVLLGPAIGVVPTLPPLGWLALALLLGVAGRSVLRRA